MKRIFGVILSVLLLCSCSGKNGGTENYDRLTAGVMTGEVSTYSQLKNSMIATLEAEIIPPEKADLSKYDIIFLDDNSVKENAFDVQKISEYVRNGGTAVLANSLYERFDKDFIGAAEFKKIDKCPTELDCPDNGEDIKKIQELLCDFINLYKDYKNYDTLSQMDYGYAVVPSSAESIADSDGAALYTLNKYGSGYVFFTNPLLPNIFSVNDLTPDSEGEYLSDTTVGANILLKSMIAEFVSIKKYGYAVWRTFGSFGTKPASWELHYEDITGIENESAVKFDELCRSYGQFPSYTLARNPYTWFERAESVTYLNGENGSYEPYSYENAYSSGRHFVSAKKWVQLDAYQNTESYFSYDGRYTKRAYPCFADFDKDGKTDMICGSADGGLYFYSGQGEKDNYEFGVKTLLTDNEGNAIGVGAYSSPAFADIDADGIDELLSGSENGKIYCFKPISGCAFEVQGEILDTGLTDSMIDTGDLNGDGLIDLAVGSRTGEMRVYYGEKSHYGIKFVKYITVETDGRQCAPCIDESTLYAGTGEGYIMKFKNTGDTFVFDSYLDSAKKNYNGNNHLKFGENCVPRFYDVNGDGKKELAAGQLEYGMAYPIDSPYFPCREKLQKQLDYFSENNIYVGIHSLTQKHADYEQELSELDMHKKAFESYGLKWDGKGANQHTWFTSERGYDGNYDNRQGYDGTYRSQYASGLLWNSGSQTPSSGAVPQISAENSISVPFYLFGKMLMLQPSNTPYGEDRYSDITTKYELPLLFYNHCDYIYEKYDDQENQVKKVDERVKDNGYCFVGENQLAKSAAAALNTRVYARRDGDRIVLKAETIDKKLPLYDSGYAACTGVKVTFGSGDVLDYSSDASVWRADNHGVYVSLDNEAVIERSKSTQPHITAVNIPAKIKSSKDGYTVKFLDDGMMQVTVDGNAEVVSGIWQKSEINGKTVFTKYGKAQTLKIRTYGGR